MGLYHAAPDPETAATQPRAEVIALGNGAYKAVLHMPGSAPAMWQRIEIDGKSAPTASGRVEFVPLATSGPASQPVPEASAVIKDGKLTVLQGPRCVLHRVEPHSPTEGASPPPGAVVLLPYEPGKPPSLSEWTNSTWKPLSDGSMLVGKGNNKTVRAMGSMKLHLEFRCPLMPTARGQARGNSGVYVQDRYEVQVLDSFGLVSRKDDCGSIYGVAPPRSNACYPPGSWQTYDITFRAAEGRGKQPRITVVHNGVTIQDDVALPGVTRSAGAAAEGNDGPLMLQDHGNPVRYRNIWYVAIEGAATRTTQ
jgi:hypothetical protein